jgi:23S rRNA pseudouridine2605 synthase
MLNHLSIEVLRLVRVAVGPLVLGELAKGVCRPLAVEEKRLIDREFEIARRFPLRDKNRKSRYDPTEIIQ